MGIWFAFMLCQLEIVLFINNEAHLSSQIYTQEWNFWTIW